jgi:NAD(P)-dependent dehydrogenase (short-subunit alcohol dehydrogenase family)
MVETSGRNAVVTGAAGGMGRAITKALLESGRRVVLADRDPTSLREFAAEMGDNTFPIELDITDTKAVDRLPDLIPDASGRSISSSTMPATTSADGRASMPARRTIGPRSSRPI